jgi:hypothetical protein
VLIVQSKTAKPTFVVSGTVSDTATGKPIAGARVSDDAYGPKPYRGATTDANGKYSYTTWPEEHSVVVEALGYEKQTFSLTAAIFQKEKQKTLDFALTPAPE